MFFLDLPALKRIEKIIFFYRPKISHFSERKNLVYLYRSVFAHITCASTIIFWSTASFADSNDTVNSSVGYAVQKDSNLFRLPSNTPSQSEQIGITSAEVSIDKSYSLQRFLISSSLINYNYQTYKYLSFNAFNYSAVWQWSLTPYTKGVISTDRQQVLNSFSDFRSYSVRNIRTEKNLWFDGETNLGAAIRLLFRLDAVRRANELPGVVYGDREAQGASVGVRYILPSDSFVSYRFRTGSGQSNNGFDSISALPNDFKDQAQDVQFFWTITSKTSLSSDIGYIRRQYPDLPQRNFNGPIFDVTLKWDITGKTSMNASVRREIANYQSDISNFVVSNRVIAKPLWKATAHINVFSSIEYAQRNFAGGIKSSNYLYDREDNFKFLSLGVEWRPIRSTVIALEIRKVKNSSNLKIFGFESNGGNISGKITF